MQIAFSLTVRHLQTYNKVIAIFTDENTQITKKVFQGMEQMNIITEPKKVFNNVDL